MNTTSLRIQTIANGAGISYGKAEKVINEMARINGELTDLMNDPSKDSLDWDHTAGYIQGMRKALTIEGADGAVIDLLLKDMEAGRG
jgi:hypothetical protein